MDEDKVAIKQNTMRQLDSLKHNTQDDVDFWFARDLEKLLGYVDWGNFLNAIQKAKIACSGVGVDPCNHFGDTTRMVSLGSGAKRSIEDVALTRYACYLIAMNAEPSKPAVADAQTYFAIQTRRQELSDQQTEGQKRLMLRDRVKDANNHLGTAAKEAGVQNWALFQDAGYRGLYGGFGVSQLKEKKGISSKEELLDCVGRTELAANEFRITQTEQKLSRKQIKGDNAARETHREVAKEVRNTIQKIGGTMPEDLPREPSIKQLKKLEETKELPPSST